MLPKPSINPLRGFPFEVDLAVPRPTSSPTFTILELEAFLLVGPPAPSPGGAGLLRRPRLPSSLSVAALVGRSTGGRWRGGAGVAVRGGGGGVGAAFYRRRRGPLRPSGPASRPVPCVGRSCLLAAGRAGFAGAQRDSGGRRESSGGPARPPSPRARGSYPHWGKEGGDGHCRARASAGLGAGARGGVCPRGTEGPALGAGPRGCLAPGRGRASCVALGP